MPSPRPGNLLPTVVGLAIALCAASGEALLTYDNPSEYRPGPGLSDAVVYLTFETVEGNVDSCTGTLLAGETHILTAAHCLTDETGTTDVEWVDVHFPESGTTLRADFDAFSFSEGWSGVPAFTPADLAIIELPGPAPAGIRGLEPVPPELDLPTPLPIQIFGYGNGGEGGLDPGLPPGVLRVGFNHYDDPSPLDPWQGRFNVFDFDDYSEANNQVGEPGYVTTPGNPPITTYLYMDLDGDGDAVLAEVMTAGGDSGGPSVLDIYLVGVHSWIQNGVGGDVFQPDGATDAADVGFGWIAGDVSVAAYSDWIYSVVNGATIPEAGTGSLLGAALWLARFGRRPRRDASQGCASEVGDPTAAGEVSTR